MNYVWEIYPTVKVVSLLDPKLKFKFSCKRKTIKECIGIRFRNAYPHFTEYKVS